MPWRECHKMDERLRFVASLLDGEKMAVLCREFEISRKTGSKIFSRYKDCGLEDLTDRSHARQLPFIAQRSARCTRSWIGTAWSSAGAAESTNPKAHHSRAPACRTIFGAPTTRASSCSPIGATATR